MSERQIDEAIDQAVRDLMNVDADSAFRARVVDRLRKPKSRPPFWRQLAIASGAAAIVVISVVMTRDGERPAVEAPPAAASAVTPQPAVAPVAAEPSASNVARPAALPIARRRQENPTHQITPGRLVAAVADEAFELPLTGGVDPLSGIRPIELAPIVPAPIITTEITVAPIAQPSELVIAPLAPQIEQE
jgi:hypothetical protein